MTNPSNEPVAKAVVLTTGIGLQWIGDPLPAGTKLYTRALPAQPADAMLINKCIQELRAVAKEMQK